MAANETIHPNPAAKLTPIMSRTSFYDRAVSSKPLVDTSTLCGAVATSDLQLVEQLLESGANVNEKSPDGFAPLCIAAFWGYAEIVKLLLEAKADINATNSGTGWTACHCAAFQGHGKVLMYLIQYQPDITIQDTMGRTAVDFASAQDPIWPFFSVLKCKRTSKEELICLNIIQKLPSQPDNVTNSGDVAQSQRLSRFNRPGSSYILADLPMGGVSDETTKGEKKISAARAYGDVLYEEK